MFNMGKKEQFLLDLNVLNVPIPPERDKLICTTNFDIPINKISEHLSYQSITGGHLHEPIHEFIKILRVMNTITRTNNHTLMGSIIVYRDRTGWKLNFENKTTPIRSTIVIVSINGNGKILGLGRHFYFRRVRRI